MPQKWEYCLPVHQCRAQSCPFDILYITVCYYFSQGNIKLLTFFMLTKDNFIYFIKTMEDARDTNSTEETSKIEEETSSL